MTKFIDQAGAKSFASAIIGSTKTVDGQSIWGSGNISTGGAPIEVAINDLYSEIFQPVPGQVYHVTGYPQYIADNYSDGEYVSSIVGVRAGGCEIETVGTAEGTLSSYCKMIITSEGTGDAEEFTYSEGDVLECIVSWDYSEISGGTVRRMYDRVRDIDIPYDFVFTAYHGSSALNSQFEPAFPIRYTRSLHMGDVDDYGGNYSSLVVGYKNENEEPVPYITNVYIGANTANIKSTSGVLNNIHIGSFYSGTHTEVDFMPEQESQIGISAGGDIENVFIDGSGSVSLHAGHSINGVTLSGNATIVSNRSIMKLNIEQSAQVIIHSLECIDVSIESSSNVNANISDGLHIRNCKNIQIFKNLDFTKASSYALNVLPVNTVISDCDNFTWDFEMNTTNTKLNLQPACITGSANLPTSTMQKRQAPWMFPLAYDLRPCAYTDMTFQNLYNFYLNMYSTEKTMAGLDCETGFLNRVVISNSGMRNPYDTSVLYKTTRMNINVNDSFQQGGVGTYYNAIDRCLSCVQIENFNFSATVPLAQVGNIILGSDSTEWADGVNGCGTIIPCIVGLKAEQTLCFNGDGNQIKSPNGNIIGLNMMSVQSVFNTVNKWNSSTLRTTTGKKYLSFKIPYVQQSTTTAPTSAAVPSGIHVFSIPLTQIP